MAALFKKVSKFDYYRSDETKGSRLAIRVRGNRPQDLRNRLFLVPFAVIAVRFAGIVVAGRRLRPDL
jgi:hypothetical protein